MYNAGMNDFIIAVDLDGTLKTDMGDSGPFEIDSLTVESGSNSYTFSIRPHVHEFLQAASSKGRLYLSTAGGRGYANRVLKAMEIEDYFDKKLTAEDFMRGIPFMANCIFIDNDGEMGRLKMEKMPPRMNQPIIRQELWVIDTFTGNSDDNELLDVIEELSNLEV